jgi:hypothetical protein
MSIRQGSGSESEGGKRTTIKLRMSGSPDGTPRGSRAGSPAGGLKSLAVSAGSRPGSPPASTPGASGKAQVCKNSPCEFPIPTCMILVASLLGMAVFTWLPIFLQHYMLTYSPCSHRRSSPVNRGHSRNNTPRGHAHHRAHKDFPLPRFPEQDHGFHSPGPQDHRLRPSQEDCAPQNASARSLTEEGRFSRPAVSFEIHGRTILSWHGGVPTVRGRQRGRCKARTEQPIAARGCGGLHVISMAAGCWMLASYPFWSCQWSGQLRADVYQAAVVCTQFSGYVDIKFCLLIPSHIILSAQIE